MAGKKKRKRQTASKKKDSKEIINEEHVLFEEKKPKLDDELKDQAEQSDKHANHDQQPNLETTVGDTNDDVSTYLQTESDSKYVPPFTRKPKRALQRDISYVSPDVTTARTRRSWRGGKQNSKQAHQSPADQQTDMEICGKASPNAKVCLHSMCIPYAQVKSSIPKL